MTNPALIPDLIETQRWFGARSQSIARVDIIDEAVLDNGPPSLVMALARITFETGTTSTYSLVLLEDEGGGMRDAFADPDRFRILGDLMAHGAAIKGTAGVFEFGGVGLDPLAPPGGRWVWVSRAEQSNSSLIFDDDVILKLFRRVEPGVNPDLEINRMLTNEGFVYVPPQVGEISYHGDIDGAETEIDLGIAQRYIADGTDGWEYTFTRLRDFYDSVHPLDASEDRRALTEERGASLLDRLERLGDATAEMHVLLSREEVEPEFTPEPVERLDLEEWSAQVKASLGALSGTGIEALDVLAPEIERRVAALRTLEGDLGLKTRVHGDYHLGQVLLSPRGPFIIDFEGEPLRPLETRRAKQSPLKDAAGMLRSFGYAALAALSERAPAESADRTLLAPWADAWEELVRDRFLHAYLRTSYEGRFLPADRATLAVMLDVLEIEKALYELEYERGHRPEWMHIPLAGIERVLRRGRA